MQAACGASSGVVVSVFFGRKMGGADEGRRRHQLSTWWAHADPSWLWLSFRPVLVPALASDSWLGSGVSFVTSTLCHYIL
jgi:hypothetical protein